MAKIVAAKCPSCAATLDVEVGAPQASCSYCGQTSLIARNKREAKKAPGPVVVVSPPGSGPARFAGLIAVVGVTVAVVMTLLVSASDDVTTPKPADDRASIIAREHNRSRPPARSLFSPHDVCICRTDLDGDGTNETTAQLATRVYALPNKELLTTYYVDITGQDPWYLPVDELSAPAMTVDDDHVLMYVVCHQSTMLIASDDRATGWDMTSRKRLWTTPLGGRYVSGMAKPQVGPDEFTHQCTRVNGNPEVAEIQTVHGVVNMRLADGVVVPAGSP